ncbi:MAG: LLM class flavin-dependent oxidoreductase, partial [Actinomycetota bacterium]|nr:LLM class flavin-dependent oxidoreductase [Actinomycetota bacterium]
MNTDHSIPIDRLARGLEERGYESLWVGEHSHIPVHRETPYPGGGELPMAYTRMADPFVGLMAAGAATERLRLGTGVC